MMDGSGDTAKPLTAARVSALGYTTDEPTRKGYTGYEKDAESSLEFAQARYYSTTHGRYTSVDPLTASASIRNPQTFNRYTYVLNSPYKYTDPLGLLPLGQRSCGQWCTPGEFVDGAAFRGRDTSQDWAFPLPEVESSSDVGSSGVILTGALERNLKEHAQERLSRTLGTIVGTEGSGNEMPGTIGLRFNCIAYCFGVGGWAEPKNPNERSRLVISRIMGVEPNGRAILDDFLELRNSYSLEDLPKAYGAVRARKNERTPFGYRRLRAFLDPDNVGNYHIIRQNGNGTWSSKNR